MGGNSLSMDGFRHLPKYFWLFSYTDWISVY